MLNERLPARYVVCHHQNRTNESQTNPITSNARTLNANPDCSPYSWIDSHQTRWWCVHVLNRRSPLKTQNKSTTTRWDIQPNNNPYMVQHPTSTSLVFLHHGLFPVPNSPQMRRRSRNICWLTRFRHGDYLSHPRPFPLVREDTGLHLSFSSACVLRACYANLPVALHPLKNNHLKNNARNQVRPSLRLIPATRPRKSTRHGLLEEGGGYPAYPDVPALPPPGLPPPTARAAAP